MEKQRKTALITGAGSGIGRAIAVKFAEMGVCCVLAGRRKENLEETKRLTREQGVEAILAVGDVTEPAFRKSCIQTAISQTGRLDILVNNAGMTLNCPLEETSEELFDQMMSLNVKAPYFLCQQALPYLRKSEEATIINIASASAHNAYAGQSLYGASKHAVLGFSKTLASEVYQDNIRVHVISPGSVYTDLIRIARPDLSPEGMMLPEDVADVAAFYIEHRRTSAVIDEVRLHRAGKEPFL